MKRLLMIVASLLLLAAISLTIVAALYSPRPLDSRLRRSWKDHAVKSISLFVGETNQPEREIEKIRQRQKASDEAWMSDRIILMNSGEWLAYTNICHKEDRRIPDLFLAHGSDSRWYFSTYHFCKQMVVLRMDGQPDSLTSFSNQYFLRSFDGKSDESLESTWPVK